MTTAEATRPPLNARQSKELESLFASEAGSRHSIAIGELQDFQLEELPTGSGILNIN